MKNSIYLILIPLMISIQVAAQDTTRKTHYGVNLSMASYYSDLAFASPSLQISRRICTYTIGPLFVFDQKSYSYKSMGVGANFYFISNKYPIGIFPVFDFGLQYFKTKTQPDNKEIDHLNYFMGFGIGVKVTPKFALYESFGLGNNLLNKGTDNLWMIKTGLMFQLGN